MQAVDIGSIVHVLRLARDDWPEGCKWETDGFAAAVWNGLLAREGEVELTGKGRVFLDKFGPLYPESVR